jgi:hypothetical protein
MDIKPNLVKTKSVAGYDADGKPIVYVLTHGGLHAFFGRTTATGYEALGTGPLREVAKFIAEKRRPGLTWNEEFLIKSEDPDRVPKMFMEFFFSKAEPSLGGFAAHHNDFIVYHPDHGFDIVNEQDLKTAGLPSGTLVRRSDLSGPITKVEDHG